MKDKNYQEATSILEYLKNNYPYSQYAALSELALADMQHEQDNHAAAANAYADFVKAHPSHPKADYAAFQLGLSHYEDRPSDFWLLPPSYEKDQTPLKQALDAWNKFVVSYPKSEFVTKARDLIGDCRQRLAAHDRYVAEFYSKREAWRGAAGRWLALADTYGDLDGGKVRGDALWRAAFALQSAHDISGERNTLVRLVQESPNDPRRTQAIAMLKQLPADAPAPLEKAPEDTPQK
jgi:outer membrane protein assembly factor BamD